MTTWNDLVGTVLLGTRRRTLDPTALPPGVREIAEQHTDPADQALVAAAAYTGYRRAGQQPLTGIEPEPAAAADDRPFIPPVARARLVHLLSANRPELVEEWLTTVAGKGFRVPAE
ncbi:hypothetical protein ABT266_38965, partial [Amycolatopsis sp. NPDC000746]